MRYWVACVGIVWARAEAEDGAWATSRKPTGWAHAIGVDDGAAACGVSTTGLQEFPELDWEESPGLQRCTACTRAIGLPNDNPFRPG